MESKSEEKLSGLAAARLIPQQFRDLAPFLEWALATEPERSAKRQASPMEEINAFYQAISVVDGYDVTRFVENHEQLK